jgi:hypothetical protein
MGCIQCPIEIFVQCPKPSTFTFTFTEQKHLYSQCDTNENLLHSPIFYMLDKVNVNSKKMGNVIVNHLHFFTQRLYVYLHLSSQNWSTIQKPKTNKTFYLYPI